MKWILDDILSALAALKHGATWVVIGMIKSKHEMQQALKHGIGWGSFAVAIAIGGLIFFNMNCR